eukprot:NODE_58_length_28395_cov_1.465720.p28 type:complete len:108 gc:universal NODE_58_length_28395_cov_1.465720:12524-12847(+)
MKRANENIIRDYKCALCAKLFSDKSSLLRHSRNVHSPSIPCKYCEKKLKIMRSDAYRTHLIRCKAFSESLNTNDIKIIYERAYIESRQQIYPNQKANDESVESTPKV